jgi:hypothetical protein
MGNNPKTGSGNVPRGLPFTKLAEEYTTICTAQSREQFVLHDLSIDSGVGDYFPALSGGGSDPSETECLTGNVVK